MERDVLVVGESLVDIVHAADGSTREYAGGSAANVAVALARLGRPVRFVTAWADDERGRVLAEHLDARRRARWRPTRTRWRGPRPRRRRSGADGAASYEFDLEWRINAGRRPSRARWSCTSARSVRSSSRAPTRSSRWWSGCARRATVSYDVNARPAITGTGPDLVARVERMAALADLVKASDEDLASLYPDLDLASRGRRTCSRSARRRSW